jgi:hypothetical protein
MIVFGLLDLLSFYRSAPNLIRALENFVPSAIGLAWILLVVSLLASGPLNIVGNRFAYVIYYFQFPLKLAFLTLTFGFLFKIIQLQVGTLAYGMLTASVIALEATRLMLTIQRHRHIV